MASQIDSSKPVYGTPTTQSVRDNFETARLEITQLQDTRTPNWPYLPISGGIMTGKITLDADPIANLQAATKQYVDNLAFSASGTIPEAAKDGWFYARGGAGTPTGNNAWSSTPIFSSLRVGRAATVADFGMSVGVSTNLYGLSADNTDALSYNRTSRILSIIFGSNSVVDLSGTSIDFKQPVTVAANPTAALGVATKQYVDNAVTAGAATIVVSDTAPVAPTPNALWWDSVGTQLYLWYNDGTSTQWVNATNAGMGALNSDAPTDGQTYGRRSGTWNAVPVTTGNVGRNLIHNGMFNVQQRGVGPFTTNNVITADRWKLVFSNDTGVQANIGTMTSGAIAAIGDESAVYNLTVGTTGNSAANAFTEITQGIEIVKRLAGKTITISFWATASVAGFKLGLNGYCFYGTGGSPSSPVSWQTPGIAVTLTTGWARYSVTFTVPSSIGKTLGTDVGSDSNTLQIFLSSSTTNGPSAGNIGVQTGTVQLWGVQLEIGSVATPLEKIEYADDLRHCQRFYFAGRLQTWGYVSTASSPFGQAMSFPVTLRGSPSVAFNTTSYSNAASLTLANADTTHLALYAVASGVGGVWFDTRFTASADL